MNISISIEKSLESFIYFLYNKVRDESLLPYYFCVNGVMNFEKNIAEHLY